MNKYKLCVGRGMWGVRGSCPQKKRSLWMEVTLPVCEERSRFPRCFSSSECYRPRLQRLLCANFRCCFIHIDPKIADSEIEANSQKRHDDIRLPIPRLDFLEPLLVHLSITMRDIARSMVRAFRELRRLLFARLRGGVKINRDAG